LRGHTLASVDLVHTLASERGGGVNANGGSPDLAALLADPASVPAEQIPAVLGELEQVKAALWARLVAGPAPSRDGNGDRLLTAQEVSPRASLSVPWLYRHAAALPFTRRIGRKVLFSEAGLTKWLATRPR
jgi:predicted DNA-binding transcriptional regulator AlpA